MTKKKKSGGKKLTAQQLQIEVLKFLLSHPKKQFSPRQITDQLRVTNNKDSAEHALRQLVQAGSVAEHSKNKFGVALEKLTKEVDELPEIEKKASPRPAKTAPARKPQSQRKIIEGRVDMTRSGAAYIVSELMDTDVYVPPKYVNGALNGDIVKVLLFSTPPRRKGGKMLRKPEGEVL
ncbi:MAG: hypothetical protein KDC61_16540, partial [Saprospiraceae bacterium]|nr:hypothetical protein [Saprospiraceae bacterium]